MYEEKRGSHFFSRYVRQEIYVGSLLFYLQGEQGDQKDLTEREAGRVV